jgi:hypothetical protein
MQIQGFWQVFLVGAFGGSLVELLRWYKLKESPSLPDYASRRIYWVLTVLMILAGGGLAALYGLGPINAVTVANIGASAPALIGALAAPPRQRSLGIGDEENRRIAGRDPTLPHAPSAAKNMASSDTARTSVRQFLSFGE